MMVRFLFAAALASPLSCFAQTEAYAVPDETFAVAPAADGLVERLAACATCHGERGEGVEAAEYYPHLAGKPAQYLFEQLTGFRDGRRHYAQMVWLVQFLDDTYLREIADFYAAQAPRTHVAETPRELPQAVVETAQRLVREGDASRGLPACSACHGESLTGLEPAIPSLVGLPADYVIAQIGAWQEGVRRGVAPDCMAEVAKKLEPDEVRAAALWLAQQSREIAAPSAAGSFVPPVACGSMPSSEGAR